MSAPSRAERACAMFDSFCKSVIRNASRNLKRDFAYRRKREITGAEETWLDAKECSDTYPCEDFHLREGTFSCCLSNEKLYQAILSLPEQQRIVLILDFWCEWPDTQISNYLGVTARTVYNLRQRAFKAIQIYYGNGNTSARSKL